MQGATTLPAAAATAIDLISQFNDDVLLHILGFLPATRDVARTSVLSKRWRHLWSIAPCHRFNVGDGDDGDNGDRDAHAARLLIAAVDATVARCTDVDILEISFDYGSSRTLIFYEQPWAADVVMSSHSRVAAWLRFAGHVRRSFAVDLPPLGRRRDDHTAVEAGDLAELPRSARLVRMRLQLGHATLTVPVAGVGAGAYSALTDFQLHRATLVGAGADNLGHLLSSPCSPRLRRLGLAFVHGLIDLRLHAAGTLEELELVELPDLRRLDVDAPGLRLLHVDLFDDMPYPADPTVARISAPRLEALACDVLAPAQLQFDGAVAVRHIKKLVLYYPIDVDMLNATTVWLLNNCTAMDSLELDLVIDMPYNGSEWPIGEDIMNDVPELPSVTNLAIIMYTVLGGHTIGATLAKLIAKCKNVEYISIGFKDLKNECCSDPSCFCRQPEGWEDWTISLEHLRAVDICCFTPSDNWIRLVQLLLANSLVLETMTVELDKTYLKEIQKEKEKSVEFDVPCSKGFWTSISSESGEDGFNSIVKYKWTQGR